MSATDRDDDTTTGPLDPDTGKPETDAAHGNAVPNSDTGKPDDATTDEKNSPEETPPAW
jgi:hypothetical protein